jgi:PAS domain S-box-containing protein
MWVTVVVLGTILASATTTLVMFWRRQQRTRRLAALEREVEQTRLLRLFFDLPFLGMARLAPDARHFLQFNDRFCEIVGYPRRRLESTRWMELVHPDDVEANLEALDRVMRGASDGFTMDERLVRKDGETVFASVDIKCVRRADGAVEYLVVMLEDISERKHAEAQLQRTLGDLEHSNRELEQFAYVASHDLQEPLRMVSSYTQLLADRYEAQLDERAQKYIRYAVDGAHRMHALINDLLAYSRAGAADKPLEPTDTRAALGEAMRNLAAAISENQAVITHDDLPTVLAHPPQLVLVFQNLIANAIKFRGTDVPHIHVSAQDRQQEWLFSVRDNGIGIELQHADRVFVIFQRLHTREEYPGTGIGLAVCQRIVERLGGRIWFESMPGTGTTFLFTIPKQPTTSTMGTAGTPS